MPKVEVGGRSLLRATPVHGANGAATKVTRVGSSMDAGLRKPLWTQWKDALAAPWVALARPRRAVDRLQSVGWTGWAFSVLTHIALWTAVIVFLSVYEQTTYYEWTATTGGPVAPQSTGYNLFKTRSLYESWESWNDHRPWKLTFFIAFGLSIAVVVATVALGMALLPYHFRGGSVLAAWTRASRLVLSQGGIVIALTSLVGVTMVAWIELSRDEWFNQPPLFIPLISASLCILAWYGSRLERGVFEATKTGQVIPPLCEGCGYDLTAANLDGRCPECGYNVAHSLQDHHRTRPPAFHRRRRFFDVFRSARTLIFDRQQFYSRLAVRSSFDDGRRAQRGQWLWLGILAWLWIMALTSWELARTMQLDVALAKVLLGVTDFRTAMASTVKSDLPGFLLVAFPLFVSFLTLAVGWLYHRLVGGVVSVVAYFMKAMPFHAAMATVIGFETAFLWVICAYNGTWITAAFIDEDFLFGPASRQLSYMIFRMPPQAVMVFIGNGLLTLLWFWRYSKIIKAVRWSNV